MPLEGDELEEFLAAPRLAHFATVSGGGRPRVRPLWYAWADGAFWFTTRLQARYTGADVADGSSVAVSIASEDRPYRAVLARWSGSPFGMATRRDGPGSGGRCRNRIVS